MTLDEAIKHCEEVAEELRNVDMVIATGGETMPTRKTKGGGYRYGKTGKTYYGKGAKAKADRQGRAIKASQKRRKKK